MGQDSKKLSIGQQNIQNIEVGFSRGLTSLFFRQAISYGAIFVGNIFLSRWLPPETYGLFAAVLALQQILLIFSDVGIGPALVQRAEKPTGEEISSLFTIQFIISIIALLGLWLLAPTISKMAKLGTDGIGLVLALAFTLVIIAFRSIPAMLLERDLRFEAIALAESTGFVAYQVVLICLVWFKVGINSIVLALFVRYILDLIIIIYFYPWRPRLSFNFRLIFPYLRFGVNMQGVRVMGYAKDYLPVLILIPLLGSSSAGIWSWAITYIGIPVYFNRLVDRTIFPLYSRIQNDRQAVGELANTAFWLNFATGLPVLLILVLFSPNIIPAIYGSNWLVAIPIVVLLIPNMLGGFITGSGFPILYATGQSKKGFKLFTTWVMLTAITGILGIHFGELDGLAIAYSLSTVLITILLLHLVKPVAEIKLKQALWTPVVSVIGASFCAIIFLNTNWGWVYSVTFVIITYGLLLYVLARKRIHRLVKGGINRV